MKLCHYDEHLAGVVHGNEVYPVGDTLVRAGHLKAGYTMLEVIEALAASPAAMALARDPAKAGKPLPLASVKLLAPILNPPTIWCAAANYKDHQEEMKTRVQSNDRSNWTKDELMAEFFMKPVGSIIGPGGSVLLPKVSKLVDFECELCAVIGKRARKVSEAKALDYVFGYTILWDMSQRDPWGVGGKQNTRNIRKGFDTFTGLGPWIVTADEIPNPHDLRFQVEQNGKVVMNAWTGNMITNLHDHIRFLSDVLTLTPGTLISTGTPAGVSKLHHGDRLKGTMDRIGSMELDVVAEAQ
jgi:2-keto-4-pentenoate hydratase/2-oxohepta-3-ene-1,7-dioic acid hydratase in catechol pathway